MLVLRKSCHCCERCGDEIDKPGFVIEDRHGSTVALCLLHMVAELEMCLLTIEPPATPKPEAVQA